MAAAWQRASVRQKAGCSAAIAALLFLSGCQPVPFGQAIITLDPSKKYQVMVGWEATAQAGQSDFPDWINYKDALLAQAAADGINRLRMEINIKDENTAPNSKSSVNDNDDPFSINMAGFQWGNANGIDSQSEIVNLLRARLSKAGEPLPFISLCYVDFGSFEFEHSANPEEYAELMEAAFTHLSSKYGWVPDAIEVILEPDHGSNAANWNATKIGNSVLATQRRLVGHGWNPRFILPSTVECPVADDWYQNVKAVDANVIQYVDELSYHRYDYCNDKSLEENRVAAEADGNRISMLEWIGATYTTLHEDLKHNAVAWQQASIAYDDRHDIGTAYYLVNHTSHSFSLSRRMKFLRHYFKYIRRGAVRISATTNNAALDPLAFINTNGKYVVVGKATAGGRFEVKGLAPDTYGIKYTTTSEHEIDAQPVTIAAGQTLTTGIPNAGVITIYGTIGSAPLQKPAESRPGEPN